MENNPELRLAWQFIENTGTHLFLTGKAGTGKTTFLRQLKEHTPKRMIVLAPTGIAAINAGGVTIHSFFQLPFAPYVPDTTFNSAQNHYRFSKEKRNIIRSMDLLVIDEISMVRADLLDAIDATLRRYRNRDKPFGGVQLLMIGDLQQLAPVVKDNEWELLKPYYDTPYFFASRALKQTTYMTIELKTVYRQSDNHFLSLLNKVRENVADEQVLRELNRRYQPGFQPPKEEGYIRLTTHNYQAQQVNERELALLPGRAYTYQATIEGNFPEYAYPTDDRLTVKEGAQIMFIKNDTSAEKRYYNGMIGIVVTVNQSGIWVRGKDSNHDFQLNVEEWSNSKYVLDDTTKEITEQVEGTFKQYPIRLAWAITIHKSQGLTFEKAIIDARNSFAHGQTYVALSRCKTLEGMVLESPLCRDAIISDAVVGNFTKEVEQNAPDNQRLQSLQQAYFRDLLGDLFDFYQIGQTFKHLLRLIDEHLYRLYPKQLEEYKEYNIRLKEKILDVAQRFRSQYTRLVTETENYATDPQLQGRIRSGAAYFYNELLPFRELFSRTQLPTDNKELKKQVNERMEALDAALSIKERLLDEMRNHPFSVTDYLRRRARILLGLEDNANGGKAKREKKERTGGKTKIEVPTDILHPELYNELVAWRTAKTREVNLPAYVIMQQKALIGMTNLLPDTPEALEAIPYFGKKGVENYGLEILSIIRKYMEKHQVERPEIKEVFVPKKPAEEKKSTKAVTYEMFRSGMSIEEIAKARELVTGTIAGHLEDYVRSGEIKVEDIVAADKLKKIVCYVKENGIAPGLALMKAALGDDVSYADLKLVIASLS